MRIYKVEELIFCSSDISSTSITGYMTRLGNALEYKIVPKESSSIIGSSSKNSSGEVYTVDIRFNIDAPIHRRNKRLFDIVFSGLLLILAPILMLFQESPFKMIQNCLSVLFGKKTWVGYTDIKNDAFPKIKRSVLNNADVLPVLELDKETKYRLDFLYAKDYEIEDDINIMLKAWKKYGK